MSSGSFINHVMAKSVIGQPSPEIGMGVTLIGYSDRHPGTVIELGESNKKKFIRVQQDNYKRVDSNGMSESQEYEYFPNTKGLISNYRLEENGVWQLVELNEKTQRWNKVSGNSIHIGEREKYYDYSF